MGIIPAAPKRRRRKKRRPEVITPPPVPLQVSHMAFAMRYWATLKHVSLATVRRLVKTGQVRAVRIGGQIRIYERDWAAYEAAHRISPAKK